MTPNMAESRESFNRRCAVLRMMMGQPEEQISLASAALLIASAEYPEMDPAKYIQKLDEIGENISRQTAGEMDPHETISRMNQYLFDVEGFVGNSENYYDPRNSFLNEVIDRKTGIPITLSTVYLEIAERLKLPLVGVGLPGHFLVKHPYFNILIDPYSKGRILTEQECREQMERSVGEEVPFHPAYLEAVTKRHIITRMLNNLRAVYTNVRQYQKALDMCEMSLILQPDSVVDLKQKAALLLHLKRHSDAIALLTGYLETSPDVDDAFEVREMLVEIRKTLAKLN